MAGMCLAKMCIFALYPSKAWAPPAFLEGGGGGGGHHLTAVNKLSAFGRFNQRMGVGGGGGGGGCCPLLADSISEV